jgi:hypothetical protein
MGDTQKSWSRADQLKILAEYKIKWLEFSSNAYLTLSEAKVVLTSFPRLQSLKLPHIWGLSNYDLMPLCDAFRMSTCDHLQELSLELNQDQILMAIACRWPHLLSLEINKEGSGEIVFSEKRLYEIMACFINLETLRLRRFCFDPIEKQLAPGQFNSIKELCISYVENIIFLLKSLPSLRIWRVGGIYGPDLKQLISRDVEWPLRPNLNCWPFNLNCLIFD